MFVGVGRMGFQADAERPPRSGRKRKFLSFDECGGYGFLTAAFCRAVGIPARVVWGCLYDTSGGGVFGQHGWNEIYMGEAGWIPLDTTRRETDYVDSGHIRIGVHRSTTTALNARKIEILDFRIGR